MKKSEADKRIEDLEKRIKALEEQPKTIVVLPYVQPVVIREVPVVPSWPIYPQITWTAGANTADVMCLS